MDFTALKTAITTAIKQNGNEEITGDVLQQILLSMVGSMGDSAINQLVTQNTMLQSALSQEASYRLSKDNQLQAQINGVAADFDNILEQVRQLIRGYEPIIIHGDVTNAPDEEDLTSNAQHLLQFKNNAYNPIIFSGMGKVFLRKNLRPLSTSYDFNGFVEGVPTQAELSGTPDQIYWDRTNEYFVGLKDGVYYLAWTDDDAYVPTSESNLYMYEGNPYRWNGSEFYIDSEELPNIRNILTQDMISEANTIYIIRYDYTLKENITIPANCVLQFDGGSISGNGENMNTITADKTLVIKSDKKCFSDILFSGDCCENNFYSKWFTNPSAPNDKAYNHTSELQAMFDCGAHNFAINGGFYYVTNTLNIQGSIDIYTEFDNSVAQIILEKSSMPIIYSDQVVTIINYEFTHTGRDKRGIYIGAIHLFCDKAYTAVTQESVNMPILKINSKGMLWRADVYATIKASECSITQNSKTKIVPNYAGIELSTSEGNRYMTMVRLFGDIYNTYQAITTANNGSWFTGIEIFGNTQCVKGIDTTIDPLILHGIHQRLEAFEIFGNNAFFYGKNIIDDSYVFDIGIAGDTDLVAVNTKCIAFGVYDGDMQYAQNITQSSKKVRTIQRFPQGAPVLYTKLADNNLWNLLSILVSNEGNATNPNLFVWSYKINNTDIFSFTDGDIYNIDKLFLRDIRFYGQDINGASGFEDVAFISFANNNMLEKIEFEFSVSQIYLEFFKLATDILFRKGTGTISSCILEIYDNNGNVIDTINIEENHTVGFFNRVSCALYGGYDMNVHFKFTIIYSTSEKKFVLPYFGLTTSINMREINSLNTNFRLPRIESRRRVGFNYFDPTLNKVVYWTGTAYVDATGATV